jgi:hypothetical protein
MTAKWSADNNMNVNTLETEEMIINVARPSQRATAALMIDDCRIERHRLSCSVLQYRLIFVGAAAKKKYALMLASAYTISNSLNALQ